MCCRRNYTQSFQLSPSFHCQLYESLAQARTQGHIPMHVYTSARARIWTWELGSCPASPDLPCKEIPLGRYMPNWPHNPPNCWARAPGNIGERGPGATTLFPTFFEKITPASFTLCQYLRKIILGPSKIWNTYLCLEYFNNNL